MLTCSLNAFFFLWRSGYQWKLIASSSVCFHLIAWPQYVTSARLETCLSVLPLLAPSSPFPLPNIRFMCCRLPPSPGLDPEYPPSLLIWFEASSSLTGNPPNNSHHIALCTRMHVHRYMLFAVCAYERISDRKMLTHAHRYWICKHTYTYTQTHRRIHVLSCPPFPRVLLIDSACSCKGLWWKTGGLRSPGGVKGFEAGARESEKEGWRIRPTELH